MEAVVVAGEVEIPAGLSAIELLGFPEEGEVLMVGEDVDGVRGAFEIVAPGFEGADDTKKFAIVDLVVAFGGVEGLGEVCAGMPVAIGVALAKDSTGGEFGCI